MIEGEPLERKWFERVGPEKIVKRDRPRHLCGGFAGIAEPGHDQDRGGRSKSFGDSSNLVGNGNELAVVQIAVDTDENFWLDLAETVEDNVLAEIRRAG